MHVHDHWGHIIHLQGLFLAAIISGKFHFDLCLVDFKSNISSLLCAYLKLRKQMIREKWISEKYMFEERMRTFLAF